MKRHTQWQDYLPTRLPVLIVSFILAIGLWVFVNSGQEVEEKRTVRIQYSKIPPNLTFERTPLREVSIGLSGPLYRIRSLKENDLTYLVDLSQARAGTTRIELTLDALRLPLDLEATFPSPRVFYVYLEEVEVRALPVRPKFIGRLAEGLTLSSLRVEPEVVTVEGPRSLVSKLDSVPVEISLEGRQESFSVSVKPELDLGSLDVKEGVLVDVEIVAAKSVRDFVGVPVKVSNVKAASVEPAVAKVVIEGSERALAQLNWQPEVRIEAKGLRRGRFLLRGVVDNVPEGLKVLEISPPQFLVEVLQ